MTEVFDEYAPKICQQFFDKIPLAIWKLMGRQKYILVSIRWNGQEKIVARTAAIGCPRHKYILDEIKEEIKAVHPTDCNVECLGGGWIDLRQGIKGPELHIYGESEEFGRADHKKAVELLNEKFKEEIPILKLSIVPGY